MLGAKSFQSCPTLCDPMDYIPPGSSVHEILFTEVSCHALLQGIFPIQEWNPCLLESPALVGGFITTSAIWET